MGAIDCVKWMVCNECIFQDNFLTKNLFFRKVEEQAIDPNLRDSDGATAVHFAASRGHIETLTYLLEHGAYLTFDKYGKSPLNDAAENEQVEVSIFAYN